METTPPLSQALCRAVYTHHNIQSLSSPSHGNNNRLLLLYGHWGPIGRSNFSVLDVRILICK